MDDISPEVLIQALGRVDGATRDDVILCLEVTPIQDEGLRLQAMGILRDVALELRHDSSRCYVFWSALRKYLSMIPTYRLDEVMVFLGDDNAPTTIQCVAQTIASMRFGPALSLPICRLQDRIHVLALEHIDPSKVRSPEDAALASSLFQASVALQDECAPLFLERIKSFGRPYLYGRNYRFFRSRSF